MQYKLVKDGHVIDILSNPAYVCFLDGRQFLSPENYATGVLDSECDVAYHIKGARDKDLYDEEVAMIEITDEEADTLRKLLESEAEVKDEDNEYIVKEPQEEVEPAPSESLESIRQWKLKQLSKECQNKIFEGFDITWDDGKTEHFSLTLEDQLNLLEHKININEDDDPYGVLYHADGEGYIVYSTEQFARIYDQFYKTKTHELIYFNKLKNYVNSLDDIHQITNIEYGIELPEEFQ